MSCLVRPRRLRCALRSTGPRLAVAAALLSSDTAGPATDCIAAEPCRSSASTDREDPGTAWVGPRSPEPAAGAVANRLEPAAGSVANLAAPARSVASAGAIARVSVASGGAEANGQSFQPAVSADGRFVAFESHARNLVGGDTNGAKDVFVHDRLTGATERVSVAADGSQGNGSSESPDISADGRFVAFQSRASNLVTGDTNRFQDVFVHDRLTRTTRRVSVTSSGGQVNGTSETPAISGDGRFVAFASESPRLVEGDTNAAFDVFVHDLQTGTTVRVSIDSEGNQGNQLSIRPAISGTGRFVAFESAADNLVPGDTNESFDVFVRDRAAGATMRVSVSSAGGQANDHSILPAISSDGQTVAFTSFASNLVQGDTNGVPDIIVRDLTAGTTTRVSVSTTGLQANGTSEEPELSADGRLVAFESFATSLVPGDTNGAPDVFVRDRHTGETIRASESAAGAQANGASFTPSISYDGRIVAFASSASNLVAGDANGMIDIFSKELAPAVVVESCGGLAPTVTGTEENDVLTGTGGADVIDGRGGNDRIEGLAGDDVICGGSGFDILFGGPGDDRVYGQAGNDALDGGFGEDLLQGGNGEDLLQGGEGRDALWGGEGNDRLLAGPGDDLLEGELGFDRLEGGEGRDILNGRGGNDYLFGGKEDDELDGGDAFDTCDGGPHLAGDSAAACEAVTGVP